MIGLILFAAAFVIMQLHVLTMAIVGNVLGAKIVDFGIFFSPTLFQFKVGSINVKFNAIPLGGYVKFTDDFETLAAWKRIVTALSGCFILILTALSLLGFDNGLKHFGGGFAQIIWGALMPFSTGKNLVAALFDFGQGNSFLLLLGLFASKLAALNLLPFGALNGGTALIIALKSIIPVAENVVEKYQIISLLIYLLLGLSWLIALITHLLS